MSNPMRFLAAFAVTLAVPLAAHGSSARERAKSPGDARSHVKQARATKVGAKRSCVKPAVEVLAGSGSATLSLAKCDGTVLPAAIDRLSTLARARGTDRLDARLIERLETAVDHFRSGDRARIVLVSGFRPRAAGNYHAAGRALDFRIDGVPDQEVAEFCKTLADTGCGYYPNAGFVHLDIRDPGTGHVAWTDTSRPGQSPHYATASPAAAPGLPALPARGTDAKGTDAKGADEAPPSEDDRTHAI